MQNSLLTPTKTAESGPTFLQTLSARDWVSLPLFSILVFLWLCDVSVDRELPHDAVEIIK